MRIIEVCRIVIILVVLCLVISGCQEERQIWGQGNPPADYQNFFGNDNIARLNFLQTTTINQQGQVIAELVERVRKLEEVIIVDPNVPTLESRIEKLEEKTIGWRSPQSKAEEMLGKDALIWGGPLSNCTVDHQAGLVFEFPAPTE